MLIADLIYGPRRDARGIRPTLVDMDTVRELAARAKSAIDEMKLPGVPPAVVTYQKRSSLPAAAPVDVPEAELDAMSAHDRNTLGLSVQRGPAQASVTFGVAAPTAVLAFVAGDPQLGLRICAELENTILNNGVPIWRPHLLRHLVPVVGASFFAALWVWLLVSASMPLPGVILGWVVSVGVAVWAVRWSRRIRVVERSRVVSHRIRTETRAETYSRRVDQRANLKVALWSIGATAILAVPSGYLLAVLTDAAGLKG